MIKYVDSTTTKLPGYVVPPLVINGLKITVPMGTRVPVGDPLEEGYDWELHAPPDQDMSAQGILVKDKSTGKTVLFVDEVIPGIDEMWVSHQDDPFEWIAPVFDIRIPAGTTDLNTCDIKIWRCIQIDVPVLAPAPVEG